MAGVMVYCVTAYNQRRSPVWLVQVRARSRREALQKAMQELDRGGGVYMGSHKPSRETYEIEVERLSADML